MMVHKVRAPKSELLEAAFPDDDPAELLLPAENYTLLPFHAAFNNFVAVIAPLLKDDHVYDVTAFYSRRRPLSTKEHDELTMYNQRAFRMAKDHGLTLYYQGHEQTFLHEEQPQAPHGLSFVPDCMSFCIWESLSAAKAGAALHEHREAAQRVSDWYEKFVIRKFSLVLSSVERNGVSMAEITIRETELVPSHY